ncbi:hypothetical protein SCH4B_3962 [Ruegeria sp. TrichCH4B]|nr:hypothetical protein SCH4B_3962 [Ruegeria sp. TrichCH4B]
MGRIALKRLGLMRGKTGMVQHTANITLTCLRTVTILHTTAGDFA